MNMTPLTASVGLALLLSAPAALAATPAPPSALRNAAIISPKAPGAAMLAVARAGSRLVATGERGIVLISDDNGARWLQGIVPVQTSLTALRFVDRRTGWAAGHMGTILKTGDGGASWTLQFDGVRAAALRAAGLRADGNERAAAQLVDEGPDKPFFDLDFADPARGYAVGAYNLAVATTDGGRNWTPLSARLPNPKSLHLLGVRARGDAVYIAGEQGLLLRSMDGGASFQSLPSPYQGSFFGLLITRPGTLLAYGLRGSLFRSTDHGATWGRIDSGVTATISAGIEDDAGGIILLTQTGDTLASQDDGVSFRTRVANLPSPAAGLAVAPDGGVVLATLRGMRRQPQP